MANALIEKLSSLKDRPLSFHLNLAAVVVAVLVVLAVLPGALRGVALPAVGVPDAAASPAQVQAELAGLRAQADKLAAELKAIQTDLRDSAAVPKDAKLAAQQQQASRTLKDIVERQERLEQIIVANPGKALELALLQRDLENLKAVQQKDLAALGAALARSDASTRWVLVGMALSILLLVVGSLLKGREP